MTSRATQRTPTDTERERPAEPQSAPTRSGRYEGVETDGGRAVIRDVLSNASVSSDVWHSQRDWR